MTIAEDFFMLPPQWSDRVVTVLGFNTRIRKAITGYEARNALLEYPMRKQEYLVEFMSSQERNYAFRELYGESAKLWGIPLWGFGSPLTSQASSGQPTLAVDTTLSFFEDGQTVCLYDDFDTYELEEIVSSTDNSITLSGNLVSTWPTGTVVYPVLQGYIEANSQITQKTSIYGGIEIKQREVFDPDITRLLGSHSFSDHHGMPVFNLEPNWASEVRVNLSQHVRTIKGIVLEYAKTYQSESDVSFEYNHLLCSKADTRAIVSFFMDMRGRWHQFWVPTWMKDIVVTSAIGSSDTTITIEDIDYVNTWATNDTVGKKLYFLLPSGSEKIRDVTGWPTTTSLTMDSSLGEAVSEGELPVLVSSFLMPSRFNNDELEVIHNSANVAEVAFTTMSLPDDSMTTTTTTV